MKAKTGASRRCRRSALARGRLLWNAWFLKSGSRRGIEAARQQKKSQRRLQTPADNCSLLYKDSIKLHLWSSGKAHRVRSVVDTLLIFTGHNFLMSNHQETSPCFWSFTATVELFTLALIFYGPHSVFSLPWLCLKMKYDAALMLISRGDF